MLLWRTRRELDLVEKTKIGMVGGFSGVRWWVLYTIGTRLRSRPPEIATCVVAWLGGC